MDSYCFAQVVSIASRAKRRRMIPCGSHCGTPGAAGMIGSYFGQWLRALLPIKYGFLFLIILIKMRYYINCYYPLFYYFE